MMDAANSSLSTQAGPSRLPDSRILDEDDIGGITPKAPSMLPLSGHFGEQRAEEDTPALRLRALLARVPTDRSNAAAVPSSPESEIEAPDFGSSTMQSYAKESLASLFSHARREAGDTPVKSGRGRARRNSVDASDLDSGSPRVQKVREETKDYKGKRKSLSDEESEGMFKFQGQVSSWAHIMNAVSSRKSQSQAVTFDLLRVRLGESQSQLKNIDFPSHDPMCTYRVLSYCCIRADSWCRHSYRLRPTL